MAPTSSGPPTRFLVLPAVVRPAEPVHSAEPVPPAPLPPLPTPPEVSSA